MVVPYVYLWRRQHEAGEESGRKTRPCLIVIARASAQNERVRVAVCPLTTQPPDTARAAIEVPPRVITHLRLTARRSWVICDEYNEFDWPDVDLETTPSGNMSYGFMPDAFIEQVRGELRAARVRGALKNVPRTD